MLDAADQLRQALVASLDIEVGHAVDGRAVPTAGAAVGYAAHARAVLRQRPAQGLEQQAVTDQELLVGGRAVVVMGVAGQLLGNVRVKGHVEQVGAVLQVPEVAGLDEAGAGVIALVTENAVQLQRVADGFVDLQDHLVGHQQQVPRALGRVGGQQQLQGLVGHPWRGAYQAEAADHIKAALLAKVAAAQGAGLAVVAVVGGHIDAGEHKTLGLSQLRAGAVEVDLFNVGGAQADFPVYQALVPGHGR